MNDSLEQHLSILNRLVEPTDPEERALAIRICRVNAHLDPDTGVYDTDHERSRQLWKTLPELPIEKWLWMWNYGRDEWKK